MIKVRDVKYIRLRAPDLDQMETFLTNFGLQRSARTDTALYMRGTDPEHHLHVTELGDAGLIGFAFDAASEEDLHVISELEGASDVEDIDEPGGGKRVRIDDPDGKKVEVVWGIEEVEPIPLKEVFPFNSGSKRRRIGPFLRSSPRPSQVKRLGHIVLQCDDFNASSAFYQDVLGMLSSDNLHDNEDKTLLRANFLRCNRGQEYTDHHTILCTSAGQSGLGHVAYEVEDWNDLAVGHYHLQTTDYEHRFGIGRHVLGAQLFDYWGDPWGHNHEHWTDGDVLNEDTPAGSYPISIARDIQWGPERS